MATTRQLRGRVVGPEQDNRDAIVDLFIGVVKVARNDVQRTAKRGAKATPRDRRLAAEAEQFLRECREAFRDSWNREDSK